MAAPTNISAATAVDITALPYSITQTVDDAGTTYTVWYKYTAQTGDNVIGIWGLGSANLTTYIPTSVTFSPNGSTSYLGGVGGANKPFQIPVTAGVTYYFRFTSNGGNPTPAVLTLSVLRFQDQTVPEGSLAVNDDTPDFPLTLLSVDADETPLAYVQDIVAGEAGDILPSGLLLLENFGANLILYDSNYSEVATVASVLTDIVTTNKSDTFYIGKTGSGLTNSTWTTVDSSGVLGPTTWDLGTVGVISGCVSPDETILYYIRTGNNRAVQRWDLVNDLALSDLATGIDATTATSSKDMLSFSDGSVIVLYRDSTNSISKALHYSAAGATLNTYTFTYALSSATDRLCYAEDEASFWVWLKGGAAATAVPTMLNVRISDGSVLTTRVNTYYEGGTYRRTATATPTSRFGMSNSCPFWITRTSVTPAPPSNLNGPAALAAFEAEGTMRAYRIVWSRRAPHLADENQRVFYQKFQLDLEAGVGTVTGQGITPTCELRWSNDGGFTWSGWRQLGMGPLGEYRFRAIARQLGMARDRVFEVRGSDPVKVALLDAYLEFTEGLN